MSNDRWLVVHDTQFYPTVFEFDNEEEAVAKYHDYQSKLMKGDTLYLTEITDIAEVSLNNR